MTWTNAVAKDSADERLVKDSVGRRLSISQFVFLLLVVLFAAFAVSLARAYGSESPNQLNTANNSATSTSADQHMADSQPAASTVLGTSSGTSTQSVTNSDSSSQSSSTSTNITVNGHHVAVPNNGNYDKTVVSQGNQVHVSGSSTTSGNADGSMNVSETDVEVDSD